MPCARSAESKSTTGGGRSRPPRTGPRRRSRPVKAGQAKAGIRNADLTAQGSSLPWRRRTLATAISLFNVLFGERLERRRVQLAGVALFADAYWRRHNGVHAARPKTANSLVRSVALDRLFGEIIPRTHMQCPDLRLSACWYGQASIAAGHSHGVQVPLGHAPTYLQAAHAYGRTCPVLLAADRRHDLRALYAPNADSFCAARERARNAC